jgi:hypothetical protein
MSYTEYAKSFIKSYYETFDNNRHDLASLYRDGSLLTLGGLLYSGTSEIAKSLVSLPYRKFQHHINNVDAQPCHDIGSNNIIITVTGDLLVNDENSMKFVETFLLIRENGAAWVSNQIFGIC